MQSIAYEASLPDGNRFESVDVKLAAPDAHNPVIPSGECRIYPARSYYAKGGFRNVLKLRL